MVCSCQSKPARGGRAGFVASFHDKSRPVQGLHSSTEVIRQAVMPYVRLPLTLRKRRGLAARTRRRRPPRDGAVLVEPLRTDVPGQDPETPRGRYAIRPLAVAPRRGFRENQRRAALSLAGGRSRERGAGMLCDQDPRQESSLGIPQESDASARLCGCACHWQAAIVRGSNEAFGRRRDAGNRSVGKRPGRECAPAVSKARACHALLSTSAKRNGPWQTGTGSNWFDTSQVGRPATPAVAARGGPEGPPQGRFRRLVAGPHCSSSVQI